MSRLTNAELEKGWVEFHCADHGFLAATTPRGTVTCACGKRAYAVRNGRKLPRTTLLRIKRSAKSLQMKG